MKLSLKFNLIFIAVFGVGLAATGWLGYQFLRELARDQVIQQARLIMEASSSTRKYTSEHIQPLLQKALDRHDIFHPESIPAFSAQTMFAYMHKSYPEYFYREATLNPTNPDDRAADWEADIINHFRNDRNQTEIVNERDTPAGRSLFLAKPIKAVQSCLTCHGSPDAAPAAMTKLYGRENGFRWKVGEVVTAQIVSVPMAIPRARADAAFKQMMFSVGGVLLLSLVLLNVMLISTVLRPIRRLSVAADEISQGNLDTPELPAEGKDEISTLAGSFNRMHRSLVKAVKMLEG
jgi:HAMP domain-containing protein